MTVASDGVVCLRLITAEDLPVMAEWDRRAEVDQPFNYFSDGPVRDAAAQLERTGFGAEPLSRLMVTTADGTLIGDVSWHAVGYGPNERSTAYNIGIALQPAHRGMGYGTRVQRLLADHLFATTTVFRVEASTDVENIPEQRALTKAGFTREGVLRGAQFRADSPRDLVLFSRLRTDS